jgi:hypothetical protein
VVDDAPQVLEEAVDKGVMAVGLLFSWNRAYADNGFRLYNNLNDVMTHIMER